VAKMAVGILRARGAIVQGSSREGFRWRGWPKSITIVVATTTVGISRPSVGCYSASELMVGVSRMLRQVTFC